METFLHAVASVTIILLLTATGYFCAVKGWMTVQVKTFISRYLMTVGIPVMLIYGMQNNLTRATCSPRRVCCSSRCSSSRAAL